MLMPLMLLDDFSGQGTGLICFYSLKNPSFPELVEYDSNIVLAAGSFQICVSSI